MFCNIHTADHTLILSMLCLLRKKHNNSAAKVVIFIWIVQMFFVFLSENPLFLCFTRYCPVLKKVYTYNNKNVSKIKIKYYV